MKRSRPLILWLVVIVAARAAPINLLETLGAFAAADRRPWSEVLGHAVLSLLLAVASAWTVYSLLKPAFRSKLPVSLYLWLMLLIYPDHAPADR